MKKILNLFFKKLLTRIDIFWSEKELVFILEKNSKEENIK